VARPATQRSLRLAAAAALLAALGCGYHLVGYESEREADRTVAIVTPSNESYVPGVEFVVADALRREFLRRGALRVTENADAADLVIAGRVRRVATRSRSFSSVTFALEFQLEIVLDLEAQGRDGVARPISDRSLRESEYYLASADVEATRKNRDEAIHRVADLLAQRVHDNLVEASFQ